MGVVLVGASLTACSYRLIDLNLISACVWLCTAQVQRALVQPWDWREAPGNHCMQCSGGGCGTACLPARPAAAGGAGAGRGRPRAAQYSASTPGLTPLSLFRSVEYTDCMRQPPAAPSSRYSTGLVQRCVRPQASVTCSFLGVWMSP